mgnify:CR=1 FL=1
MEQTMIKTENVSKRFGSFALQDIHFELPAGYICGLIGENGVGKTTLLNILAGLYEYDGTISIQEKEYRTNQMELQQDIGFVFHEEWFDDWDSLIANSRHYGKYYKNYDETLLKEYLKRFRLDGKKKYKKLSKGEKLKFAFAFALAHHPKLLLLDEPTSALDPEYTAEVLDLTAQLRGEGIEFVIVTHEMGFAREVATRVIFTDAGVIEEEGTPDEIFNHPKSERLKTFLSKVL